jgi:hypothetical protein
MRYGHPQQTQIVGRVPIGVGLLAASLTGEVLAPARSKRAAARATLARRVRLHDLDADAGDVGLVRDDGGRDQHTRGTRRHVHDPVEAVLDGPMCTNDRPKVGRLATRRT